MMLLHEHHVIHRDLKPENILLDEDYHPLISDFGLSKFFDPLHSMYQSDENMGTAPYMAPEVITSDCFNSKADVYSFGILMYEVISGKRAYEDLFHKHINAFMLKENVVKKDLRPDVESLTIKEELKKMMVICWSKNPKERPTFREIFQKLSLSKENYFFELYFLMIKTRMK